MRASLVIAVAQPPSESHDVVGNAARHAEAVRAAQARVVAFPELSLTGYELDATPLAPDDARLSPIVDACGEAGALALAGAPVLGRAGGSHIATLAIDGAGASVAYRKMWLGDAEAARYEPGDTPAAIEVEGWRLGLAVCKDTGIDRHAADTAALGIDVYVAGMTEHARDAGVLEERAVRVARGHGVWVAMASFAGPTGGGYAETAGRSGIWAPDGAAVARASSEPGALARATLA